MANYSFVRLQTPIVVEDFEVVLRGIVEERFQGRLRVEPASWEPDLGYSHVWWVFVPGTEPKTEEEARDLNVHPSEAVGFPLEFRSDGLEIAFRHSINSFARWIQGVTRERIARHYDAVMFFDATDESRKADPKRRERNDYPTFLEFLYRNFKRPVSEEDASFVERSYRPQTPEGWWT